MPHYRTYNNTNVLCVTVPELLDCGVSEKYIKKALNWQRLDKLSCWPHHKEGREIYLHYHGLSDKYRLLIDNKLCEGKPAQQHTASEDFIDNLFTLEKDKIFLNEYRYADGSPIEPAKMPDLYKKCAIFNLVNIANPTIAAQYGCKNMPDFWEFLLKQIRNTGLQMPNKSYYSLKRKAIEYREQGPMAVIDGRTGNNNAQLVTPIVERLLLNLFARDNKPYFVTVHTQYISIITGKTQLTDLQTGELFNPEDFTDKNGNKLMISRSTVYNWIMRPYNQAAVQKVRSSGLEFSSKLRPHVNRHAPNYALSKISMDDIEVPFKMEDGTRIKAYQVFDVASGACIGTAFSKDKNRDLFIEALRNMFVTIICNGWKIPAEVEVEQHISNTFKDDLLRAGEVFPFVRWCRGGNPQEKRAEGKIRRKKYSVQKQREGFQYRPFTRLESNRLNEDKNKKRYTYQEIVNNELQDIAEYNKQIPTDKYISKKYPGMTRMQILENCQHPELSQPDLKTLAWYVGNSTETTIRRGMYVLVKNEKYMLPSPKVLINLKSYEVTASYIQTGKEIDTIYLYQDGKYICECKLMESFNESTFEQTEEDLRIMHKQQGYIAKFDKMIRDRRDWAKELRVELENETEPATEVAEEVIKTEEIKTKEPDLTDMSVEERLLVEKFGNSSFRKY